MFRTCKLLQILLKTIYVWPQWGYPISIKSFFYKVKFAAAHVWAG